jgi:hypothetical protein
VHTLPPYVEAKLPIPVRARVRGFQVDAQVLGWRGEQVYLTWSSGVGMRHLGGCRQWTSSVREWGFEGGLSAMTTSDPAGTLRP